MKKEFSSIVELKFIREKKKHLTERENELTMPILTDVRLIPTLYGWFKEALSCPSHVDVVQRKKFLYIVLFLFSPSVLAGGRLPNGIRNELSRIFEEVSPCVISNNISDLSFFFQRYKDFRCDIEVLYNKIQERLEKEGLIQ